MPSPSARSHPARPGCVRPSGYRFTWLSLIAVFALQAARNVLLGANNAVKIADFGSTNHMAEDARGRYTYTMPPKTEFAFKWCAIESLKSNLFSEYSDCWSAGVTFWEIFRFVFCIANPLLCLGT